MFRVRERLPYQRRSDRLAVALDQAAVGLAMKCGLAYCGHEQRIGNAGDQSHHEQHREGTPEFVQHSSLLQVSVKILNHGGHGGHGGRTKTEKYSKITSLTGGHPATALAVISHIFALASGFSSVSSVVHHVSPNPTRIRSITLMPTNGTMMPPTP